MCANCPHPGTQHHWKVARLHGRCQHRDCHCIGYVPDTGHSAPVNATIGRALRKKC
jgi:hypothetical protein